MDQFWNEIACFICILFFNWNKLWKGYCTRRMGKSKKATIATINKWYARHRMYKRNYMKLWWLDSMKTCNEKWYRFSMHSRNIESIILKLVQWKDLRMKRRRDYALLHAYFTYMHTQTMCTVHKYKLKLHKTLLTYTLFEWSLL